MTCKDTLIVKPSQILLPFVTVELVENHKPTTLNPRLSPCVTNSQRQQSSKTTGAASISNQKSFKPYWSVLCEEMSAELLLPIGTDSPDSAERLYNSWSNKTVEQVVVFDQTVHSPEQALTADLLAILHLFSRRMYGCRRYRNQIKEDRNLPNDRAKGDIA